MITPDDWLVIPVKSFAAAKRRLAPSLDAEERERLARAMLRDVLHAATDVRGLSNIGVVSSSPEVARFVSEWGICLIDDGEAVGLNEAVQVAMAKLSARHASAVAVVPGDIPLVQAKDIHELLAAARGGDVALAPASHDAGTNGLALSSPLLMPPRFGVNSFARHVEAARALGISPVIVNNIRFGLDLDEPARLREFVTLDAGTYAGRYLATLNMGSAAA